MDHLKLECYESLFLVLYVIIWYLPSYQTSLFIESFSRHCSHQVHWNNPEKRSDYRDSSGLTLFFTHNLRPHALGVLTMGPMALKIPPKSSMWKEQSTCTPHCTEYAMSQNVTIVSAGLHMHYAGKSNTGQGLGSVS